jgi:hypothetical protein
MRSTFTRALWSSLFLGLTCTAVRAQWSIGAPGSREAPAGKHRYAMLVFANPLAGREVEFNDWYTTTHMGDLVQLPGWVGAQRFRLVSDVKPRLSKEGYRHGYLIIWELEDTNAGDGLNRMTEAIRVGKSRLGAAFDYTPGASGNGTYEVMGPRIKRPDGKPGGGIEVTDPNAPRLSRYMLMELASPLPGKDGDFNEFADQRIKAVLSLPGWAAAQRFRMADTPGRARGSKPQYMTVWEIEAKSAQAASDALTQATTSGAVKKNTAADDNTAESVYWEPITPYITKDDFERR